MFYVPMAILEYRFNDAGITQQIVVGFQWHQGSEQLNARISLTQEYVHTINDKLQLDAMNKEQIESFARRKLRDVVMTGRPEDEVTE